MARASPNNNMLGQPFPKRLTHSRMSNAAQPHVMICGSKTQILLTRPTRTAALQSPATEAIERLWDRCAAIPNWRWRDKVSVQNLQSCTFISSFRACNCTESNVRSIHGALDRSFRQHRSHAIGEAIRSLEFAGPEDRTSDRNHFVGRICNWSRSAKRTEAPDLLAWPRLSPCSAIYSQFPGFGAPAACSSWSDSLEYLRILAVMAS